MLLLSHVRCLGSRTVRHSVRKFSQTAAPQTALSVGQVLEGARWNYQLIQRIESGVHRSRVFKAEILPRNDTATPAKWALIKTASPDDKSAKACLKREYDAYQKQSISTSTNIRAMYDIVGDPVELANEATEDHPCLVLEWMDYTLEEIPARHHMQNTALQAAIMNACLSSLVTLHGENLVHTDIKPANILVSDVDTAQPAVKLADLGLVQPNGFMGLAQPSAMRAPEVYQGLGCTSPSDIWSLAATVFCWLKPGVFGLVGNKYQLSEEAWCIAKLMRLFPGWTGPPVEDPAIQKEFDLAEAIAYEDDDGNMTDFMLIMSLAEEMRSMSIPKEMKEFLQFLFVPDPLKRPTAQQALLSERFQALRHAVLARPDPLAAVAPAAKPTFWQRLGFPGALEATPPAGEEQLKAGR